MKGPQKLGKQLQRLAWILILVCAALYLIHTLDKLHVRSYYADPNHYILASGTVSHIAEGNDGTSLYLSFSDLSPGFSDRSFAIRGENYTFLKEQGLRLELGARVQFVASPWYAGDGYIMPIVGLTVDGKCLLEPEQGIENFLKWIDENWF